MGYDKYWEEAISRVSYNINSITYDYDSYLAEEIRERETFLSKIDLRFLRPINDLIEQIGKNYSNNNRVFTLTRFPTITFLVPNIYRREKNKFSFCVLCFEEDYLGANFRIATVIKTDKTDSYDAAISGFYINQESSGLCPYSKLLSLIAKYPFFDFEHNEYSLKNLWKLDQYGYNSKYINKNGYLSIERTFSCKNTPEKIVTEYLEYMIKMLNESRFINVFTPIFEYYKKMYYYSKEYYKIDNELREVNRKIEKLINPYGY